MSQCMPASQKQPGASTEQSRKGPETTDQAYFNSMDIISKLVEEQVVGIEPGEPITFTFSAHGFEGSTIINPTFLSRFKSVTNALKVSAPDSIILRSKEFTPYQAFLHTQSYFNQFTSINGVKFKRQTIVPVAYLLEKLYIELRQKQDPVIQALDQAQSRFDECTSNSDFNDVLYAVMLSTKGPMIIGIAEELLKSRRQATSLEESRARRIGYPALHSE